MMSILQSASVLLRRYSHLVDVRTSFVVSNPLLALMDLQYIRRADKDHLLR